MRKFLAYFIMIACVLCACENQIDTENNTNYVLEESESQDVISQTEIYFGNRPIEAIPLKAYSILELQAYFGPYCSRVENQWAGYEDLTQYDYENVINQFPDGCLREYGEEIPMVYTI